MQQLYTGGVRMKKPLPIGVENFEDIIKSGYYYVDKTMFIKELLDLKRKVNLFTRPRRTDAGYLEWTAI
ncbi:hypothetical protein IMSAGC007_04806 [Lachnospiraceae bacterium]|nr:hypothetical protein IMSAGC007_04806 [Lachnospiraceae bacterium]